MAKSEARARCDSRPGRVSLIFDAGYERSRIVGPGVVRAATRRTVSEADAARFAREHGYNVAGEWRCRGSETFEASLDLA